ncbi:phosphotransferase [Haliea sp. E1-2-M8]|uniref:aminoglycoside phosphotransferase family protein n=1 Tax=Haliea sp. E1-2-M8 TaxID=3064706 RepID=UPI00271D587E|nr:phosphotransferase [Haliea sp. E1-2-M8]MDO8863887.1 phosphotransferase [Haliea sp. E1-2-M8]
MSIPSPHLLPWALAALDQPPTRAAVLLPVAGDASNRRYFRLQLPGRAVIAVVAPPATEKNAEFLAIRQLLERAGVRVPRLLAADLEQGFMLLEDLGDRLLLGELEDATADAHYARALAILRQLAAVDSRGLEALPVYNRALLAEEFSRFPVWFLQQLLGLELTNAEMHLLAELDGLLIGSALAQPQVLVHRDFHSRNLMCLASGELAVIDFQDAVVGPITYDPVSLLKDCYIRWPRERVVAWALAHRDALHAQGLLPLVTDATFLRWLDWMGLQRHLKVLGTFARLYLRDGKSAYLQDLPLVIAYIREVLAAHAGETAVLDNFRDWFEQRLLPVVAQQSWSELQ